MHLLHRFRVAVFHIRCWYFGVEGALEHLVESVFAMKCYRFPWNRKFSITAAEHYEKFGKYIIGPDGNWVLRKPEKWWVL